jgi:hypothetical protein
MSDAVTGWGVVASGTLESRPPGPGPVFTHPSDVLHHPAMSRMEKRALLAAWASDACAVEGRPAWRQVPESGALVPIDAILDALQALDGRVLH